MDLRGLTETMDTALSWNLRNIPQRDYKSTGISIEI